MMHRVSIAAIAALIACCGVGAEVFVGPQAPERALGIVQNPHFKTGGMSYADHWRPLPGPLRMHRTMRETGEHSLLLQLREDGDGGVIQMVHLPARRSLSLRLLATCHADQDCAVVATLTRAADGQILAEVVVDGIERGVLAEAFETGPGGPAELTVRVVGEEDGRALVDRVSIARPVAARHARRPDFSGRDLLLARGQGLRVDADFEPTLLPAAARMLQEAIEDVTGAPTASVAGTVTVSVDEPQATDWPERESYHLSVSETGAQIAAPTEAGAFLGMMTLIDLVRPEPEGDARVLGVHVSDRPALPWRIGSDPGLAKPATCANAARKLARMKLNMALVPRDETGGGADEAATAALREVGIEPVVVVSGDAEGGPRAAMANAVARLDARCVLVSPPLMDAPPPGAPLPWESAPLSEVAEFAADRRGEVTVIVPAAARTIADDDEKVVGVPIGFEGWPEEIVASLYPSRDAEQALARMATLDSDGIRTVVYHFGELDGVMRALRAREGGYACRGALITGETPEAADRAWRGLPADE